MQVPDMLPRMGGVRGGTHLGLIEPAADVRERLARRLLEGLPADLTRHGMIAERG